MVKKQDILNSPAKQEMQKLEKQFDAFDDHVKNLTQDRMNTASKLDVEPQTKIAQRDMEKMKDIYLKPKRTIPSKEKFNEDYRNDYNFAKEYVQFTAENKEVIGETIDFWIKPFPGLPAEEWSVPSNKPIWAPRYVAERLKNCSYHRLTMQDRAISSDGMAQYYGQLVVDNTVQRLDAIPVSGRKSIFMGATNFA